jgi:hypothetical protein
MYFQITFLLTLIGCQSLPTPHAFVDTKSFLPTLTMAIPAFSTPHLTTRHLNTLTLPSQTLLQTQQQVELSFKGYPHIPIVHFNSVEKNLLKNPNTSLENLFKLSLARLDTHITTQRLQMSPSCLTTGNFKNFYLYCLAKQKEWQTALWLLSQEFHYADAALMVTLHPLNSLTRATCVWLIDTNTGALIWFNEIHTPAQAPFSFKPEFWKDFPNRKNTSAL